MCLLLTRETSVLALSGVTVPGTVTVDWHIMLLLPIADFLWCACRLGGSGTNLVILLVSWWDGRIVLPVRVADPPTQQHCIVGPRHRDTPQ